MKNIARLLKKVGLRKSSPVYGYEHWQNMGWWCTTETGYPGNIHQCQVDGTEACIVGNIKCVP